MIKFQHALPSLLAGLALTLAGCMSDTASSQRAIIQTSCASNADCPADFECEVEIEHGKTVRFCQAHDDSGSCPAGLELEVEHGQTFCKPHGGGDQNAGGGGSGSGANDGGVSNDDKTSGADDTGGDDRGVDANDDDHSGSGHR